MLASVDSAKALRKALARNVAARERLREQQQLALQEKLKKGLAGERIGKHKVPEGQIDVQLGEELSESLRALKVRRRVLYDMPHTDQRWTCSPRAIYSRTDSSACSSVRSLSRVFLFCAYIAISVVPVGFSLTFFALPV